MTTPQKFVEAKDLLKSLWPHASQNEEDWGDEEHENLRKIILFRQTSHDEGVREEREACYQIALKGIDLGVAADIRQRSSK